MATLLTSQQFSANPAQHRAFTNADSQDEQAQMATAESGYQPSSTYAEATKDPSGVLTHPADLRASANSPKITRRQRCNSDNPTCDVGDQLAANPQALKAFLNLDTREEQLQFLARFSHAEAQPARAFPSTSTAADDDVHPKQHRQRANSPKTVSPEPAAPRRFSCNPAQHRAFSNADSQDEQAQMATAESGYQPSSTYAEATKDSSGVLTHPADLRASANSPKITRRQRCNSGNATCDVGDQLAANPQALKAFLNLDTREEQLQFLAQFNHAEAHPEPARTFPSTSTAADDDVHPKQHRQRANSPKTVSPEPAAAAADSVEQPAKA